MDINPVFKSKSVKKTNCVLLDFRVFIPPEAPRSYSALSSETTVKTSAYKRV